MSKNTSVSLGTHFDDFVQTVLQRGAYKNASEVIRAGLRLLEEDELNKHYLREAIAKGLESGFVPDFDPEVHLKNLRAKKK